MDNEKSPKMNSVGKYKNLQWKGLSNYLVLSSEVYKGPNESLIIT